MRLCLYCTTHAQVASHRYACASPRTDLRVREVRDCSTHVSFWRKLYACAGHLTAVRMRQSRPSTTRAADPAQLFACAILGTVLCTRFSRVYYACTVHGTVLLRMHQFRESTMHAPVPELRYARAMLDPVLPRACLDTALCIHRSRHRHFGTPYYDRRWWSDGAARSEEGLARYAPRAPLMLAVP